MFIDLNQALEVLMARRRSEHPQLQKFKKLIDDLGNPQDQLKSIHIAGTNGKGSTTNFIRSICQQQGYKVGTFTSPHLVHHQDRFRINDVDIPDDKLLALINRSLPYWDEYDITMFEIDMLIATWYFIDEQVDVAIYEVGMGGRKDATNVLNVPLASVITNISMDHMSALGDTKEKIAFEKAGIIKETGLVITGETQQSVLQVFKDKAQRPIIELQAINSNEPRQLLYRNSEIHLLSYAKYQLRNAALAYEVCYQLNQHQLLKFDHESIVSGLEKTYWKGRFEIVSQTPLTILDGAHNEDGIRVLVESIQDLKKPLIVVFSALKDKDTTNMVQQLHQVADQLIVTTFDFYRAQSEDQLQLFDDIMAYQDYHEALAKGRELAKDGTLIITGSLYFISEVRYGYHLD